LTLRIGSSNSTTIMSVVLVSGIFGLKAINIDSSLSASQMGKFEFEYESMGEPSCALVTLSSTMTVPAVNLKLIMLGSTANECESLFQGESQMYNGTYTTTNTTNLANVWYFSALMPAAGQYIMQVDIRNRYMKEAVNRTVVVSDGVCDPPLLSLQIRDNKSKSREPNVYKRAEGFSIGGKAILNCSLTLNNVKKWLVYQVDEQSRLDRAIVRSINSKTNPTVDYGELVIDQATLDYGLYRIEYHVAMTPRRATKAQAFSALSSKVDTLVRIVPSGLVIKALKGGLNEVSIGLSEPLVLDPQLYSIDLDSIVDMRTLAFRFSCQTYESGLPLPLFDKTLSLLAVKAGQAASGPNSCFDSTGLHFCFR
jgi:hypothetical protein